MAKKTKPTKAPARPRRKFGKLRALFSKPGVAMSIGEISGVLGIQTHSACAAISVLGNPAKTEEPLRIILDRSTGLYAVAAPAKGKAKKKAAPKGGGANGRRLAAP